MDERRERDLGEGHAGIIIPVTVRLARPIHDPELDTDFLSTHCSHCGRRVSRRAIRGIHYLNLNELWCYACVRSAMTRVLDAHVRYISWGATTGIDRLDTPIPPSTEEEFAEVFHRRPQFIAGLDLASTLAEHIILAAPRGHGFTVMRGIVDEWLRERTVVD